MITSMQKIYHSPDLPGDFLVKPLQKYNAFFAQKLNESVDLENLAWKILHVVTAILAYPTLGVPAGGGVLLKLSGISAVNTWNVQTKDELDEYQTIIQKTLASPSAAQLHACVALGDAIGMQEASKSFAFDTEDLKNRIIYIKDLIDGFSRRYRRVHKISVSFHNAQFAEYKVIVRLVLS